MAGPVLEVLPRYDTVLHVFRFGECQVREAVNAIKDDQEAVKIPYVDGASDVRSQDSPMTLREVLEVLEDHSGTQVEDVDGRGRRPERAVEMPLKVRCWADMDRQIDLPQALGIPP